MKKINKGGRPLLPEHLKAKPKTKPIRVPVDLVEIMVIIGERYKNGLISLDDIKSLASRGVKNVK
jgi:hypothetical protein